MSDNFNNSIFSWQYDLCVVKLDRAEKLISGLGGEKERWGEAAASLHAWHNNLLGDMLLSAAVITYFGPFTTRFRIDSLVEWINLIKVSFWLDNLH